MAKKHPSNYCYFYLLLSSAESVQSLVKDVLTGDFFLFGAPIFYYFMLWNIIEECFTIWQHAHAFKWKIRGFRSNLSLSYLFGEKWNDTKKVTVSPCARTWSHKKSRYNNRWSSQSERVPTAKQQHQQHHKLAAPGHQFRCKIPLNLQHKWNWLQQIHWPSRPKGYI